MYPRQAERVSVQEIDGEIIVLDREHGSVHQLNRTASFIWRRCDGRTSVPDIVAAAAQEFEAEPDEVQRDVARAIDEMRGLRLVEIGETVNEIAPVTSPPDPP